MAIDVQEECKGCKDSYPVDCLNTKGYCDDCQDEIDSDVDDFDPYDDDCGIRFANPGSALRMATADNPRIHPCPNCGAPNRLTPEDVSLGYQCDGCADRAEMGF